jgi:acetate---CoA ligase (ADP-forming) subunit beta
VKKGAAMYKNEIINRAVTENRTYLTEVESKDLVMEAGLPVVEGMLAGSEEEVVRISNQLGFPVALKIISPDIIHKSDAHGVKLNLADSAQAAEAYLNMTESIASQFPGAEIRGVSVQKMAPPGVEVIIGMNKDVQFGPMVMFGLGGILVEILKDVSFRIVPLTRRDAREMIKEIKGYPLLEGYRGKERSDINFLIDLLMKVSKLAEDHPEIKELDLNPVFLYREGALVVDARIILESPIK